MSDCWLESKLIFDKANLNVTLISLYSNASPFLIFCFLLLDFTLALLSQKNCGSLPQPTEV